MHYDPAGIGREERTAQRSHRIFATDQLASEYFG